MSESLLKKFDECEAGGSSGSCVGAAGSIGDATGHGDGHGGVNADAEVNVADGCHGSGICDHAGFEDLPANANGDVGRGDGGRFDGACGCI